MVVRTRDGASRQPLLRPRSLQRLRVARHDSHPHVVEADDLGHPNRPLT